MVTHLHVRARSETATQAKLFCGAVEFPCRLGRSGLGHFKREGDGKTPIGVWELRRGFYRADKMLRPVTGLGLGLRPMRQTDGWCEDPNSGQYNRFVKLPFGPGHETMWRSDDAYDVVFETSHNERPRVRKAGSAIFFHLTREGAKATAGCVAVSARDMRKILARCGRQVRLVVWPPMGGVSGVRRK
jgi:L,D-peptidoglycan transpeptidase YkuD (ErfK/YbiS/YcfS/YnhG family)